MKEKLKDCMSLILEALPYFTMEDFTGECGQPQCNCQAVEEDADHQLDQETHSLPSLLKLAVGAVLSYTSICLEQFEGYVCHANRQVYRQECFLSVKMVQSGNFGVYIHTSISQ